MKKVDIIAAIAYGLGNLRGMESQIETGLKVVLAELEEGPFFPWFLLSENNHYVMDIGERRVPLPRDFLQECEETALYLQKESGDWVYLYKASQDQLREMANETGEPCVYSLTNEYFRLFPIPDKAYKLEMIYYKGSDHDDEENPWFKFASNLIIKKVCSYMAKARRDKQWQVFEGEANTAYIKLQQDDIARREVNREATYGGDY